MRDSYKAPFGAVVWSYVIWYWKRLKSAYNDIIAGLAFGVLLVALPVMAAFVIG